MQHNKLPNIVLIGMFLSFPVKFAAPLNIRPYLFHITCCKKNMNLGLPVVKTVIKPERSTQIKLFNLFQTCWFGCQKKILEAFICRRKLYPTEAEDFRRKKDKYAYYLLFYSSTYLYEITGELGSKKYNTSLLAGLAI